jgi:hypothetical protein
MARSDFSSVPLTTRSSDKVSRLSTARAAVRRDGASWNRYDGASWNRMTDGASWNLMTDGASWNRAYAAAAA